MIGGARWWRVAQWLVVAAFLAAVARVYHPDTGFTSLIKFHSNQAERPLLPEVKAAPHREYPGGGYDGQYYAQLAVDPLLRNHVIDEALDDPPYRARRILFSWTAWAIGMGKPAWIIQVYAFQNVVVWLVLAWWMTRLIPSTNARMFALWFGCVAADGVMASVARALTDLPSLLLLLFALSIYDRGRSVGAALVLALAGLARESALLAGTMFASLLRREPRSWLRVAACVALAALPLLIWMDYLRSIYFQGTVASAGSDQFSAPFSGLAWKLRDIWRGLSVHRDRWASLSEITAVAAFFIQAGWLIRAAIRRAWSPWLTVALSFLVLGLFAKLEVWEGSPGAFTRATLPMTFGVNVLLSREPRPSWWTIIGANLGAIAGVLEWR